MQEDGNGSCRDHLVDPGQDKFRNFKLACDGVGHQPTAVGLGVGAGCRPKGAVVVRHLVRQASDRLAIQVDELDAIAAARRELSAVGNNLNQIARLGAVGRLTWNARDAALVRKVGARVDDLVEEVVHLLSALRAKQGLGDQASPFAIAADASAEASK